MKDGYHELPHNFPKRLLLSAVPDMLDGNVLVLSLLILPLGMSL